jgi:antitoxin component YwqK of YwqJK toxin-antitoxin module
MKTIITVLFVSVFSFGFAQGLVESYDESCKCTHIQNHFDNGQISTEYTENAAGKKHGEETVYYADGNIQYKRTWKNGSLDGIGTHYHRNGSVYYEESHDDGIKNGAWSFRDEDGELIQVINYSGNDNDGTYEYYHAGVKYYTQTVSSGKLISENVLNQTIYDQLKAEAEAAKAAGKQ